MDEFAYKDPEKMTPTEYDKWYCTGYVTSIAKQVEKVFAGSRASPIWQVAETEGKVLKRLGILIYLLSFIALIASAIGVSTTMIMSLLRRTEEIGVMKAIGADRGGIAVIFLTEACVIGLLGGIAGYLLSLAVSQFIGVEVFGVGLKQMDMLFPIAVLSAILIAFAGTIMPLKKALSIKPALVMKGTE
jgi:putative ABC transport system permease protein